MVFNTKNLLQNPIGSLAAGLYISNTSLGSPDESDEMARPIHARDMKRNERQVYEKQTKFLKYWIRDVKQFVH